jgi:hypothetical protein
MIGINSNVVGASTSLPRASTQTPAQTQTTSSGDSGDEPDNGINLNVSRAEDNVTTGDRSQNSASITLTTPNTTVQTDVTRQQVFNTIEQRNTQNTNNQIVRDAIEAPGGGQQGPDPLRQALVSNLIESGAFDRETAFDFVETRLAFNTAQRALDAFAPGSTPDTSSNSGVSDPTGLNGLSNSENNVEFANQALQATTRQALLFSDTAREAATQPPGDQGRRDAIDIYREIAGLA